MTTTLTANSMSTDNSNSNTNANNNDNDSTLASPNSIDSKSNDTMDEKTLSTNSLLELGLNPDSNSSLSEIVVSDIQPLTPNVAINVDWATKIGETNPSTVKLRGADFKVTHSKTPSGPLIFRLVSAQCFKTKQMIDNFAANPLSYYQQSIDPNDSSQFFLIIHFQVQSISTSFVTYYQLNNVQSVNKNGSPIIDDPAFNKLFDLILNCDDSERNNRLKFIPHILKGPKIVTKMVENRPILMGHHVPQKYFRGKNYFEIDAKIDQSMVAKSVIKVCYKFAKKLIVDMSWTIQGEENDELPERLLCGVTLHHMNFAKCQSLNIPKKPNAPAAPPPPVPKGPPPPLKKKKTNEKK